MAENVLKLKKRAVELGMSKDDAKRYGRPELEAFIAGATAKHDDEDSGTKHPAKKKSAAKKKVVAKKKAAGENKPAKKSASKKSAPAEKKSGKSPGKAKRQTAQKAKAAPKKAPKRSENSDGLGRLAIGSLDWSAESEDWNPKKGGPVERLFKALKKAKGDVDKAFDAISSDVYDFVGKKKRDGSKRTKDEAYAMLRYRLNRTKFEFARRTGQHESADADSRAAYGTGAYATVRKVKGRKAKAEKPAQKPAKAKGGRKPNRKTTTKAKSSKRKAKR